MGCRQVRLGQHGFHFGHRERMTRQTPLVARQHQVVGRIVLEHALAHQPGEPTAQRREPMRLAGEAQGLPVPLAVVVDVALEPLEHLERHAMRAGDAPLETPAEELAQRHTPHGDRARRVVMGLHPQQVAVQQGREPLRIARIAGQGSTSVGTHGQVSDTEDREKEVRGWIV